MLSFLKSAQVSVPASSQMEAPGEQDEQTVSSAEDYLTVAGHGKRLKQSTMLLAGLFVIGAVCVLVMIKKTTPSSASAAVSSEENVQIETALAQLSGMRSEVNTQMQTVSGRFNQFAQVGQIAVEDLRKNPFRREMAAVAIGNSDERSLATQQWLQEQARIKAAGLELWSITALPEGSCCMINDKVLYKGGQIDGFTVTGIHSSSVELARDGVVVELKMN